MGWVNTSNDTISNIIITGREQSCVCVLQIIIEYSVAMATSFLEFIPLLLRIGSDHYKQVSLRFEVPVRYSILQLKQNGFLSFHLSFKVIRILNELLKLCPVQRKSSLVKEKDIRENL